MTQYNSLNVKLSNSQLNKLKSSIKNETDVVLRISSNMASNSNDNTNFPHELLLTNRQVANIHKAFAKNTSIDIKLSKTQLSKVIQSGGFLGNLLGRLAGPLMNVAVPLAKNVLAALGISAAISAIDGSIKKKMLGSGVRTLIISNDEMDDILKIAKSLENSGLLLKGVSETIQHEAKGQRRGFLSMLLGTLNASLLGDILSNSLSGKGVLRAGEGAIRAGYGSKRPSLKKNLTFPPHPLTNFEIQEYYQNEPRFNGVFSRDNLPNNNIRPKGLGSAVKNGAYVSNLDENHDVGTHWVELYVNNKIVTYFDYFRVEHIPKEIMKFINRKKIITNIYRIQA